MPFFPPPVIWEDGRVSNEKGQGAGFQMRGLETKSLPRHNGRGPDSSLKGTGYSFIHRRSLTDSHSLTLHPCRLCLDFFRCLFSRFPCVEVISACSGVDLPHPVDWKADRVLSEMAEAPDSRCAVWDTFVGVKALVPIRPDEAPDPSGAACSLRVDRTTIQTFPRSALRA